METTCLLSYYGNPLDSTGKLLDRRKHMGDKSGQSENSFFAVFGIGDIRKYMLSFQSGKTFDEYDRADHASKHGYISILENLHKNNKGKNWASALCIATQQGNLEIIKFLYDKVRDKIPRWNWEDVITHASGHGHLQIVQWAMDNEIYDSLKHPLEYACLNGYIEIVKYLYTNGGDNAFCSNWTLIYASMNGHLLIATWLLDKVPFIDERALECACKNGHNDIFILLYENRGTCTYEAIFSACENGHLDIMKYLYDKKRITREIYMSLHLAVQRAKNRGYNDLVEWWKNLKI